MKANKRSALAFLQAVDPDETRWCFAFFDDTGAGRKVQHHLFGTLDEHWPQILKNQEDGFAFYFVPNKIKATASNRRKTAVEKIRYIVLDFDQKERTVTFEEILHIAPRPHMVVETSPGKYHAYWRVDDIDQNTGEDINRRMAYALGADRGVHSSDHVFRVPGGVHQKGEPFKVVLRHHAGVMDAYGAKDFEAFPKVAAKTSFAPLEVNAPDQLIGLFIADNADRLAWWNAKVKRLNADKVDRSRYDYMLAGLVRQDRLPVEVFASLLQLWHARHGGSGDKANRPDYVAGTWNKHHSAIEFVPPAGGEEDGEYHARRKAILELLGLPFNEEETKDTRVQIFIRPDKLDTQCDSAASALADERPNLYRRNGELVWAEQAGSGREDGVEWATDSITLHPANLQHLRRLMARHVRWYRWYRTTETWRPTGPDDDICKIILEHPGEWRKFRPLRFLSRMPLITPSGDMVDKPGYDETTGVIYEPINGPVVTGGTKAAAKAALERILEVFGSFPFEDEVSKAVFVSALLTPFVRPFLRAAPMFLINAPIPGTGKSLLAKLIGIVTTGAAPACISQPTTAEEMQKLVTTLLLYGSPITLIDNIERPLQGDTLNSALTEETIIARRLGVTELIKASTATTWLGTGNQITVQGDMRRRVLLCRLDAHMPNPEDRVFENDIVDEVKALQAELAGCCLTMLRAYLSSTRKRLPPYGGFEQWSETVRSAVVWLGLADPCGSRQRIRESHSEKDLSVALIKAWYDVHGTEEVRSKDVFKKAVGTEGSGEKQYLSPPMRELADVLADATDTGSWRRTSDISPLKIGHFLGKVVGMYAGDLYFTNRRTVGNISLWRVEDLSL